MGPITALAYVLVLGTPDRFRCGKQVGSYLGLIPCEDSSADHWRLGHISMTISDYPFSTCHSADLRYLGSIGYVVSEFQNAQNMRGSCQLIPTG